MLKLFSLIFILLMPGLAFGAVQYQDGIQWISEPNASVWHELPPNSSGIKTNLPVPTSPGALRINYATQTGPAFGRKCVQAMQKGLGWVAIGSMIYMTVADIYDRINGTDHPNLFDASRIQTNAAINCIGGVSIGTPLIGSYLQVGAATYRVTGDMYLNQNYWASTYGEPAPADRYYNGQIIHYGPHAGSGVGYWPQYFIPAVIEALPSPVYRTSTPEEFENKINQSPNQSSIDSELDKVLKDNPDKVQSNPTPSANASTINNYYNEYVTNNYNDNRETIINNKRNAYTQAQTNYNNNPNEETLQKLREAENALKEEENKVIEEEMATPTDRTSGPYDPALEEPEKKDIRSRVEGVIAQSPFGNLMEAIGFNVTSPNPVYHICDFNGESIDADFSRFETEFTLAGGIILALAHFGAVFIILKKREE